MRAPDAGERMLQGGAVHAAVILIAGALWATPALAGGGSEATDAARNASDALDEHCGTVGGRHTTRAARATAAVSPVLAEVSEALDRTGELHLLYWRGRLHICLGQEDRGASDLSMFVDRWEGQSELGDLGRDARERLARLQQSRTDAGPGPAIVVGVGLGAAGGALAGLAAWQGSVATEAQAEFDAGHRAWSSNEVIAQRGAAASEASLGLGVAGVSVGVAATAALIVAAVRASGAPRAPGVAVWVHREGVGLTVGGAW